MEKLIPPLAKKIPVEKTYHGDTRVDNYDWMKDKESPEFIGYLNEENEYYKQYMSDYNSIKEKIYEEIISRIPGNDTDIPYRQGDYLYYNKRENGKEYRIFCRRKDQNGSKEEILLDVNKLAKEMKLDYCNIEFKVSKDNSILLYSVDSNGNFSRDLYIKNLETGEMLSEVIRGISFFHITDDNNYLFYIRWIDGDKGRKLFRHKLNSNVNTDILVYEEKDESFFVEINLSKSGRYLFVVLESMDITEHYFIDTSTPEMATILIVPREKGVRCSIEHSGEYFYMLTNFEYENFKLVRLKIGDHLNNVEELYIAPEKGTIENFEMFKNYAALKIIEDAYTKIKIYNIAEEKISEVNLPDKIGSLYFKDNLQFDSTQLRFNYGSFIIPPTEYSYRMDSHELKLLKQKPVEGFNPEDYITKRLYAPARDGSKIPLSLVYKKDMVLEGDNPLYLYAYGSFGMSTEVYFNFAYPSLLDRGFVIVFAHVRGGKECGKTWHTNGRLLNKLNTFNDYIDSALFLIEQGFTSKKMIAGSGGSSGGTLISAVANFAPELFRCMHMLVPSVDMLNTFLENLNFNAKTLYDEFGDPGKKEFYNYMKSYDPYENIKSHKYPDILITTGYNDGNVSCSEPAKYAAKLREFNDAENIILLKTSFDSGHFGSSGRYSFYKDTAESYAFILKSFGIDE